MRSTEPAASRRQRGHDVLAAHVARGAAPGLVSVVSRHDDVHVDVIGTMAVGDSTPMRRDTIFRLSSMTKPVTAVAVMLLVEECRLRLDDPVDDVLPELADRRVLRAVDGPLEDTVPAHRPITVRDLLTFCWGFGMVMAPPDSTPVQRAEAELGLATLGAPDPALPPEPDEWMRRLGTLPLMAQPGETWRYHSGSDVLGVLVARAAGQPFDVFLGERIFSPLGMVDTGFSVPTGAIDRLATAYWTDPGTGELILFDEAVGGRWSRPPAFPGGGAGLVSTADDYLTFARMLLGDGVVDGVRILSRPSVELMRTDQLTASQKAGGSMVPGYFDDHGWGFGVSVTTRRRDLPSVGSYGWDGGLGTSWLTDPQEGLITILLTQAAWTSPVPPPVSRDALTGAYQAIDD